MKYCIAKVILIVFISITNLFAQHSFEKISPKQLVMEAKEKAQSDEENINYFLRSSDKKKSYLLTNGGYMSLQYIDESGDPIYYATHNLGAARTTYTDPEQLLPYFGLNLKGETQIIGVWDGGLIRTDHVELIDRVQQYDEVSTLSNHATHVTGTIIASGINEQAKGMAPKARARIYDFNNDFVEMAFEASEGMILSNHSYGEVLGWYNNQGEWEWVGNPSVSQTEDYRFGLYTSRTRQWDELVHTNPQYLIVKSAGNDRGDVGDGTRPADGPYDCIGPTGVAKNVLTVGAVTKASTNPSNAVMTSFSSWGPTDDGRIKPDIVGVGQNILSSSSSSPNAYTSLSGTSMAAPNVTGAISLIQEYAHTFFGKYLMAATVKALVINTATPMGTSVGPDYQYGWGLINTMKSLATLALINEPLADIIELSINDGDSLMVELYAKQDQTFDVTIAWTDVPGTAETRVILNPRDLRLVNDLDLRIISPSGNMIKPYVLDPVSKSLSTGDNFRDNVEKIHFTSEEEGIYKILIYHKGTLVGESQDFALTYLSNDALDFINTISYFNGDGDLNFIENYRNPNMEIPSRHIDSTTNLVINAEGNTRLYLSADINIESVMINQSAMEEIIIDLNGHTLSLNTLFIQRENVHFVNGKIHFRSNSPSFLRLLDSTKFEDVSLEVSSPLGFRIIGNINANELIIRNGSYRLDGNNMKLTQLIIDEKANLIIENSSVKFENMISLNSEDTISIYNSEIELVGEGSTISGIFDFTNSSVSLIETETTINSEIYIPKIKINNSTLNLINSSNLDDIILEGNVQISIMEDHHLVVKHINSSNVQEFKLTGNGGVGYISSNTKNKLCIGELDINQVNAVGTTLFVIDENSVVINGEGWVISDCLDVLDAQFKIDFPCVNGLTIFTDESDGHPDRWEWFFKSDSENIVSTESSFNYTFTETGTVILVLRVYEDEVMSEVMKEVNVSPATLTIPKIRYENGRLFPDSFADNYQWYRNGEVLVGETQNRLILSDYSGDYVLEIWDEQCILRSDPFNVLVSSSDGIIEERNIIIYPNPNQGIFTISLLNDSISEIKLYDFNGRIIPFRMARRSEGQFEISIESSILPSICFIQLLTQNEVYYSRKIMIRN